MKPAILHCVTREPYGSRMRIMAVTTAKARRYWGRDVETETPMNVTTSEVYATFTGPDAEAKARAVVEPIQKLHEIRSKKDRDAYHVYDGVRRAAETEFGTAVKALIDKVNAPDA